MESNFPTSNLKERAVEIVVDIPVMEFQGGNIAMETKIWVGVIRIVKGSIFGKKNEGRKNKF